MKTENENPLHPCVLLYNGNDEVEYLGLDLID